MRCREGECRPSPNPRVRECVKCGRPIPVRFRDRDLALERHLGEMAAQSLGRLGIDLATAASLADEADRRAHPGGVRVDLDSDQETREELADARNYLTWGIVPLWPHYQAGEPWACHLVAKRLTALGGVLIAWHALSD